MDEGLTRNQPFPETRWSLVLRAGDGSPTAQSRALADLCTLYWPPVYAFIRSKGNPPSDAEDLTQGFFAKFLRREDFDKTDASRGRLRSYLLGSVKNYLAGEHRKATRQKRGGGDTVLSFDAEDAEGRCLIPEPSDDVSPDRIFDRQWATTLLAHVVGQLEERYAKDGKADLFAALRPFISPGAESSSQSDIAQKLGMSEAAVRVAVHRLRQRYGKLLKETVADTIGEGEDADAELRELMAAFA